MAFNSKVCTMKPNTQRRPHRNFRGPAKKRQQKPQGTINEAQEQPKSFLGKFTDFFKSLTSKPNTMDKEDNSQPNSEQRNKASRKPKLAAVTSPRLYVGNLSFDATESDLLNLFNGVGVVQEAEVVSHPYTHRSKGFAFVQMQSLEEAKRAVEVLHDKEFLGRKLIVSGAKKQADYEG